jgi:hypothetical protein
MTAVAGAEVERPVDRREIGRKPGTDLLDDGVPAAVPSLRQSWCPPSKVASVLK